MSSSDRKKSSRPSILGLLCEFCCQGFFLLLVIVLCVWGFILYATHRDISYSDKSSGYCLKKAFDTVLIISVLLAADVILSICISLLRFSTYILKPLAACANCINCVFVFLNLAVGIAYVVCVFGGFISCFGCSLPSDHTTDEENLLSDLKAFYVVNLIYMILVCIFFLFLILVLILAIILIFLILCGCIFVVVFGVSLINESTKDKFMEKLGKLLEQVPGVGGEGSEGGGGYVGFDV